MTIFSRELFAKRRDRQCLLLVLVVGLFAGRVDAQDNSSHRKLDGSRVDADLRARDELMSRLHRLAGGFEFPSNDPANSGLPSHLQPEARRKLNQQVSQALRSLPSNARQPIADLIRQRLRSNGGLQRRPGPRRNELPPTLTEQDIERILSEPSVANPPDSPTGSRPGSNQSTPESPATRQARIDQFRETLRQIGTGLNSGSSASETTGSNTFPNPEAPPQNQGSASTPPDNSNSSSGANGTESRTRPPVPVPTQPSPNIPKPVARPEVETVDPDPAEDVWQKLDRIVHVARSSDAANSGARSAFARAIEDTATEWSTRAEDFIAEKSQSTTEDASEAGLLDRVGEATNSANDWAVDLASKTSEQRSNTIGNWTSPGSSSLVGFITVTLISVGCFVLYRYREFFARTQTDVDVPVGPQFLRDRRDVVRAFHAVAARFPEVLHDWWTHHRAAKAIAHVNPAQQDAINTLATLYEAARYLPDDVNFSEQQLDSARQALRRLQLS